MEGWNCVEACRLIPGAVNQDVVQTMEGTMAMFSLSGHDKTALRL